MEQLRKIVTVGCLSYVLYGLMSWFQLGTFLPPLPVKPFLFLGFAIFGLVNAVQSGIKLLDIAFYLWLVFISVLNQSFLELLLSSQQIISFQDSIEVFFQLVAVVLFVVVNTFIIISLQKVKIIFFIYFLILISFVIMIFVVPGYVGMEESLIGMSILYFVTSRFTVDKLIESVERTILVFTGVALIEVIELIALSQ